MPNYLAPTPIRSFRNSISRYSSGDSSGSRTPEMGMFKRGQGSRPGPGRAPLLANASLPGMADPRRPQSGDSMASSFASPTPRQASTSSQALPANRFGPTASFTPSAASAANLVRNDRAALAPSGLDDDDLDDQLHTFTAREKQDLSTPFRLNSWRGWANALTLVVLALGIVVLFAGYPIISFYVGNDLSSGSGTSGFNLGGINASGQYPMITGIPQLIDPDTPEEVKTRTGFDGEQWDLVFSDEFNKDGRTFFNGDDPFFEAVDIHYWPTGDFEYYDPTAVTTRDGHLVITMTQEPIHDLNFKSGMVQSWNKLCFNKNAYFEVSASLPGTSNVGGFWPGVWTMGNLGRPGFGATTEGLWPYSYDSCDIGTLANQTYANKTGPDATLTTGAGGTPLSYLPGQRYSSCTCPGEDHPGPSNDVGRAAPEIDIIEGQIILSKSTGEMSQSFQIAPYDDFYQYDNVTAGSYEFYNPAITIPNSYLGGPFQQAVSALTEVEDKVYINNPTGGEFGVFGFEYSANKEDRLKGYVTWVSMGKLAWTMSGQAVAPNPRTEIGQRIVSEEPMALIFNLGMSNNFQRVDFANMIFPNELRIDYIRVWQRSDGSGSVGCDPPDMPTKDFIDKYMDIYTNANLTTWDQAGKTFPKNRLIDQC